MLTSTQRAAFAELKKRWRYPDRLNLSGRRGSGKTFVGWVLARQSSAHFYGSVRVLEQEQPPYPTGIIIDNAPSEANTLRRLFAELQLRQVRRVLFITQSPICVGLPVITLEPPAATDIAIIYENFSQLQFYVAHSNQENEDNNNFWGVVNSIL
jgi:hypothetical protein